MIPFPESVGGMTVNEYTRLQDDGCPNCPEHEDGHIRYEMCNYGVGMMREFARNWVWNQRIAAKRLAERWLSLAWDWK